MSVSTYRHTKCEVRAVEVRQALTAHTEREARVVEVRQALTAHTEREARVVEVRQASFDKLRMNGD